MISVLVLSFLFQGYSLGSGVVISEGLASGSLAVVEERDHHQSCCTAH